MANTKPRRSFVAYLAFGHLKNPAALIAAGYVFYMLAGFALLSLPFAQAQPVAWLDNLFTAVSALSTTGLVSLDPASHYSFFGEVVILLLIQIGGLGYMTIGSFVVLSLSGHISRMRRKVAHATHGIPQRFTPKEFIRAVMVYALAMEAIGAALQYYFFVQAGVENPLWSAIFHAISAFCTAGFSLFATSFEAYQSHPGILLTLSLLSYAGAMGFIIAADLWQELRNPKEHKFCYTSVLIVRITLVWTVAGTALLYVLEPSLQAMATGDRLLNAFFQTMTAATTVGFNSIPISGLFMPVMLIVCLLMVFGASPSGTGGGLKSSTLAILYATIRSVFAERKDVVLMGRLLPDVKVYQASASFIFYMVLLFWALVILAFTDTALGFDKLVFEAISALSTVGLSMGITGSLSDAGTLVIIALMAIGRIGILSFGLLIVLRDQQKPLSHEPDIVI
jgi:trk system potassium uptake protein